MIIPSTTRGIGRLTASDPRIGRMVRLGASALLLSVSLTACQHTIYGSVPADGYRTRHPIVLQEAPQTLDIPVGMRTSRLNTVQQQQIAGFAREAGKRGDGEIQILVPSGSANESTANYMASKIRRIVHRAGIPGDSVGIEAYAVADPRAVAPIRLAYTGIRATVHQCGTWPDNVSGDLKNSDYYEFGCSSQSNLAAMISNPTDLLQPRAMTPASAARRSATLGKYEKGEASSGATEEGGSTISNVGS